MKIIAAGRHAKKKGATRMKEFGYKKIEIWLDAKEWAQVEAAVLRAGMKVATWVRKMAVIAAQKKV